MNARPLISRLFPGAVLLAGVLALAGCGRGDEAEAPARPAMVVQPGAAAAAASAFAGEVRARQEPALAFRIGGKIARRLVDVGDRVKEGQPLAELDAADVRLQLEGARAQLASAEADLALATAELERHRQLYEQQIVSKSLFDTRVSAQEAAAARVRQAQAAASASGNQAGYAVLRAPADGLVAQRLAEEGQVVAAGQTVFVLAQDGEREVLISIPEQSARDFAPGRPLAVELWSQPGKRLPATLREIAPAADPLARTYAARVSFEGGDSDIGQSARVFALDEAGVALAVPLSSLHEKDGRPAVWVVDPKTATIRLQPVNIGAYGENVVPVLAGLEPGDWIVAAGVHLLLEGQKIRPIDRENRPVALAPRVGRDGDAPATADAR